MTEAFKDWNAELRVEMMKMSDKVARSVGTVIDAMIPYRLGWGPARAARAMLCIDHKDSVFLREVQMGERQAEFVRQ